MRNANAWRSHIVVIGCYRPADNGHGPWDGKLQSINMPSSGLLQTFASSFEHWSHGLWDVARFSLLVWFNLIRYTWLGYKIGAAPIQRQSLGITVLPWLGSYLGSFPAAIASQSELRFVRKPWHIDTNSQWIQSIYQPRLCNFDPGVLSSLRFCRNPNPLTYPASRLLEACNRSTRWPPEL